MNASEKASIRHIERFSKSGIPIHNSLVQDTAGGETRRTQAIARHFVFQANVIQCY